MGKAVRASSIGTRLGLFVNREKGQCLSVYVDDTKVAGKKTKH